MNEAMLGILCAAIGLGAVFFAGILSIFFGIRNRRKGAASLNWPGAAATITRTWIHESTSTDEDGQTTTSYTPKIEFQFQVGSHIYTSQKISYGGTRSYGSHRKAQQALNEYPAGGRVTAYYDPQNPNEAVLQQGTKGTLGGIIIGIVLILVSICGGCAGLYFVYQNY